MKNEFHYRLKAAQTDLIKACGGIERVALLTGYSTAQVGRFHDRTKQDLIPAIYYPLLERDCGEAIITAVLAEATGRTLNEPEAAVEEDSCIFATSADLMMASAGYQQAFAEVLIEDDLSPAKADMIDKKARLLQRAASAIRRCTAAIKAKGGIRNKLQKFRKKG